MQRALHWTLKGLRGLHKDSSNSVMFLWMSFTMHSKVCFLSAVLWFATAFFLKDYRSYLMVLLRRVRKKMADYLLNQMTWSRFKTIDTVSESAKRPRHLLSKVCYFLSCTWPNVLGMLISPLCYLFARFCRLVCAVWITHIKYLSLHPNHVSSIRHAPQASSM